MKKYFEIRAYLGKLGDLNSLGMGMTLTPLPVRKRQGIVTTKNCEKN